MKIQTKAKCVECERVFDLLDETDAEEWFYGHDCEAPEAVATGALPTSRSFSYTRLDG